MTFQRGDKIYYFNRADRRNRYGVVDRVEPGNRVYAFFEGSSNSTWVFTEECIPASTPTDYDLQEVE